MYGAIIGDIVGSRFEWQPTKDKDFELFAPDCRVTDDSVMTTAVAEALLEMQEDAGEEEILQSFRESMQTWGLRYPRAGYGGRFVQWLHERESEAYYSFGNGSAMRVSPCGWVADNMEETRRLAALSAMPSHDHPEGIKGAESVAAAIFLARTGASREEIRDYIEKEFDYDLHRTCEDIRPDYSFDVTCQGSVPEAIIAFLDGESYEDVIREAVAFGGDSDTQAAIAGSIAEAFFGVPEELCAKAEDFMPEDMKKVAARFAETFMEG